MQASSANRNRARAYLAETLVKVGVEDRAAFRELYDLTSAKLFGICLRVCGDRQAAEDVLHEVYLIVWRRAGAWEPGRASPITWLATIARNRAVDWRRAMRPTTTLDNADDVADPDIGADARLVAAGERHTLIDCIAELEEKQRNAIRTAFFEGVTYADIARRANVPLGTAKSWIRRGLAALKLCLQDVGVEGAT